MGFALARTVWSVALGVWVLIATHVLSGRAIVDRETTTASKLHRLDLPGRLIPGLGGKMHVVEQGKRGHPIVLVHGLGGSTTDWEERIMPALAREHRVVAIDLYGFGYSDRSHKLTYDLALWSRQIDTVMASLRLKKATLIGESLGAAVVAEYAARSRGRVHSAVLLSPPDPVRWRAPLMDADLLGLPLVGEVFSSQIDHFTRDASYSALHHARARHSTSIAGTRHALLQCLRRPPSVDKLPKYYAKIRTPTLVLRGTLDDMVDAKVARAAAKQLRRGQLIQVTAAGHHLTRDQPMAVTNLVKQFVKRELDKDSKRKRSKLARLKKLARDKR